MLLDDLNNNCLYEVRDWNIDGVDVTKFSTLFKGINKGKNYQCSSPPHCFPPVTYHANRLPCLYLICSWTICILRLFPFGAKSENAPHRANGISVTMIDYLIFGLKTVHFLLIVSNICLSMFIKVFSRQCVTTSQDVSLL